MSLRSARRLVAIAWAMFLLGVRAVVAEQLPLRAYTVADGLAGDSVRSLRIDSRGFLWIGTSTGLSRFDGISFVNYGTEQGLPSAAVSDVLVTRHDALWVGTADGLARLDSDHPLGSPLFRVFRFGKGPLANAVFSLFEDRAGRLWVGTQERLLELDGEGSSQFHPVSLGLSAPVEGVTSIVEDAEGSLWLGTSEGLVRRLPGGGIVHYPAGRSGDENHVHGLLLDRQGLLWIAYGDVVLVLRPEPAADVVGRVRYLPAGPPTSAEDFEGPVRLPAKPGEAAYLPATPQAWGGLRQASDGTIQLATLRGLVEIVNGKLVRYGDREGFPDVHLTALTEDAAGDLWIGTYTSGLLLLARESFTSYTVRDGLVSDQVGSVFEDAVDGLIVVAGNRLHRFVNGRFEDVTPPPFAAGERMGWGWNQVAMRDHLGDWWLPSFHGLLRFAARPRDGAPVGPLVARYTTKDGLAGDGVFRIYEDRRGDLWISSQARDGVTRWDRATATFHEVRETLSHPALLASAFAEDRAGGLWIGFLYEGGLLRLDRETARAFGVAAGVPRGDISDLHLDRAGRLWVASNLGGAARIDDPAAPSPRFVALTTAQGLRSNDVKCIAEDVDGRLYFGTGRGVDRYDPRTGRVRTFSTADGLAGSSINVARRTRDGSLWFGTQRGLSRFRPKRALPHRPPTAMIAAVSVGGTLRQQSELGAGTVVLGDLPAAPGPIEIHYFATELGTGRSLRYQSLLGGADEVWSEPSAERTASYRRLPPGHYRFEVRALTEEGSTGEPATVSFRIPLPLWRRPWFLALVSTAAAGVVFAAHRRRVAHLVAMERVRTRIAADLHDDLGSSLGRVSILSEVGCRQLAAVAPEQAALLGEIGETARALMEKTGDIVWSIDPSRDDLDSLFTRVRRFASDLLEPRGVALRFEVPAGLAAIALQPEARRDLFLVLKEAFHNVARHAKASQAWLRVEAAGELRVEVGDDGAGLKRPPSGADGHGLRSLEQRVARLGGRLVVDSAPGAGTRLRFAVPLRGRMNMHSPQRSQG